MPGRVGEGLDQQHRDAVGQGHVGAQALHGARQDRRGEVLGSFTGQDQVALVVGDVAQAAAFAGGLQPMNRSRADTLSAADPKPMSATHSSSMVAT